VTTLRVALLGVGTIGSELVRRTREKPEIVYVALADRSGTVVKEGGFSQADLDGMLELKGSGGRLRDLEGNHMNIGGMLSVVEDFDVDVLVDVTNAQTHGLLMDALDVTHIVSSNKVPIAEVSYDGYVELVAKADEQHKILDYGTTVGAGLKLPDLVKRLSVYGVERVNGCLSGTMNYVSQRLNEGALLSTALSEAMKPPRNYAEPDPRIDLGGDDFLRKLVILGRVCGNSVERDMVQVESILSDELKAMPIDDFLEALPSLNAGMSIRAEDVKQNGKRIWYLGEGDLENDEYSIGIKEVPVGDPITRSRESDNVLTIHPTHWRRPVTVMGPGAGPQETVAGILSGLSSIHRLCR
jgi:homoserine dehydrogenase